MRQASTSCSPRISIRNILTGVAGNVRYPGLWVDHALDTYVAPQPETDNCLTLTADSAALSVRCFLPDGTQIDEATLRK